MTDRLSPEHRSALMARIKSKDTVPEKLGHAADSGLPGYHCIRHTVLYTAANPARFGKLW